MTTPLDRYVYDWCELRAADGRPFTPDDLVTYARHCCADNGERTNGTAVRSAVIALRDAGIVEYHGHRGHYRVTAVRGLDYRAPTADPRQLDLGEWD